jgi:flagellar biogenesis protein FliO
MIWFSRVLTIVWLTSFFSPFASTVLAADPAIQLASIDDAAPQTVAPNSELTYSPQWPAPPDTGAMLLRLVIGTVVVLGLCIGSLWLGKPWLQRLQSINTGGQTLQIEGSVALGNRAVLYLVKIGDTQLIAGTDASGLKSLLALPASFNEVLDEQLPPALQINSATRSKD